MNIVTINAGSSSVRLAVFRGDRASLTLLASKHMTGNAAAPVRLLGISDVAAVAHRVVHGGSRCTDPCILNPYRIGANREAGAGSAELQGAAQLLAGNASQWLVLAAIVIGVATFAVWYWIIGETLLLATLTIRVAIQGLK